MADTKREHNFDSCYLLIYKSFFVLLGNPDFGAWQKYFFRVSEGTMQISFIDLKNLVEDTNYEKVHLYSKETEIIHTLQIYSM